MSYREQKAKNLMELSRIQIPIIEHAPTAMTLSDCFKVQKDLRDFFMKQTELGIMSKHQRTAYYGLAMITEVSEMLENVRGWKPHQNLVPQVDEDNVKEEIADMMHFLINLCLEWGIDSWILMHEFWKKQMVNRKRQHDGY